jgi:signal peptidase I
MFYLLSSEARKVRINAAHWLELSQEVLNVRRDVLVPRDLAELLDCRNELAQLLKTKATSEKIKDAITRLETSLRTNGGSLYPRSWWAEYTDFFLVAAIVILGVRAYFVQPMAIPTNSMWPSYYGMTAEPFMRDEDTPGTISRLFRFVAFGATRKTIDAPKAGEVSAPFFLDTAGQPHLAYTAKEGRSWYGFPEKLSEYTFYVDGEPVRLRVLEDFHEMDDVF